MDHNWIDVSLLDTIRYIYDTEYWKLYECFNCKSLKAIADADGKTMYKINSSWLNNISQCSEIIMKQVLE